MYRALLTDCIFYYIIASAGYFSTFNATSPVVIERDALPGFDPDYATLIAAFAIVVVLCAAFPANYNPCRNQFFYLVYDQVAVKRVEDEWPLTPFMRSLADRKLGRRIGFGMDCNLLGKRRIEPPR